MFVVLAKSVATTKELPSLPLVVIPHPLGGLKPEEVRAKANKVIDEVVRSLTESRERLMAAQKGEVT